MSKTIEERVMTILKENIELENPSEDISMDDDLLLLGINSISFVKIVVALENEFNIEFEEDDLDYSLFRQAESLINYINNRIG